MCTDQLVKGQWLLSSETVVGLAFAFSGIERGVPPAQIVWWASSQKAGPWSVRFGFVYSAPIYPDF